MRNFIGCIQNNQFQVENLTRQLYLWYANAKKVLKLQERKYDGVEKRDLNQLKEKTQC